MNKIIKTIIIDDNSVVVNNLVSHFSKNESIKVVSTFNNGEDAFNYVLNNSQDVDLIILDLLLPKLDGGALLENLKKENITKKSIIISSYKDSKILDDPLSYGVEHYLIKPFSIISLENKIIDTFASKNNSLNIKKNYSIDLEISQLLHNLGIPSHIRGYKYIREGIMLIYNNDQVSLVTKEIYPQIANKFETTPSRVERAIRHAIEVSCIRGDLSLMENIFGFSVSCEKDKPTNSEFLTTIADRIKLDTDSHK